MVERNEVRGDQRQDVPCICGSSDGAGKLAPGAGVSGRRRQVLAPGARTVKGVARCYSGPETIAENELDDSFTSCDLSPCCSTNPTPGEVFHCWMVYWFPT